MNHRAGWVLTPRFGPEFRVKRRSDLSPGESFQEAVHSAAIGVRAALAHSERVTSEIYAEMNEMSPARVRRLDERELEAVIRAFSRGDYVVVARRPVASTSTIVSGTMAWGAKVSSAFRARVVEICGRLGIKPDYLMACMAFETGESFKPSIRNARGSGAVGLIQFMPKTAANLGTNTQTLAAMSAEDQLDYVEKYFGQPRFRGKLATLEDVYMAILCPSAVGKEMGFVLYRQPSEEYRQNNGLDLDKDGQITKFEAGTKVRAALAKGAGHAA